MYPIFGYSYLTKGCIDTANRVTREAQATLLTELMRVKCFIYEYLNAGAL